MKWTNFFKDTNYSSLKKKLKIVLNSPKPPKEIKFIVKKTRLKKTPGQIVSLGKFYQTIK